MSEITPEESFLLQGHALAECLVKLGELEASKDPLIISNADKVLGQTRKMIASSDIPIFRGQGVLISVFYMFLVLPFEWNSNGIGDFDKLDFSDPENVANTKDVVKTDTYGRTDQALKHFRNALSHGRISWTSNGELTIEDRDRSGHIYAAEYSMDSLGELAQSLNMAIANYIVNVIMTRSSPA